MGHPGLTLTVTLDGGPEMMESAMNQFNSDPLFTGGTDWEEIDCTFEMAFICKSEMKTIRGEINMTMSQQVSGDQWTRGRQPASLLPSQEGGWSSNTPTHCTCTSHPLQSKVRRRHSDSEAKKNTIGVAGCTF